MVAYILGRIIAISHVSNEDLLVGVHEAMLTMEDERCAEIKEILPQTTCVTDYKMLTMHIRTRNDFEDPTIRKVIAGEMLSWFGGGGGTFVLHMRVQDEFMVCMTIPGGFRCWTAQRTTAEGVDSESEVLQDATPLEDSP